jgi:hypothetical protein
VSRDNTGIIGAVRAAYAVLRDPDDADHRLPATVTRKATDGWMLQ